MRAAAVILVLILPALCSTAMAAEGRRTPFEIVRQLGDRLYAIGETTGREADFLSAVEHARKDLEDYAAAGGDPADFVERGPHGATPLLLAAEAGYGDIVAELLKSARVAASVNEVDQHGLSPWAYANFALEEAIWVCNPTLFADPFKFVPRIVTRPYYLGGDEPPYRKTRRLLEAAGAKADMAAAKQLWLDTCRLAKPESRRKVAESADLLATLEAEAGQALAAFQARQKKAPQQ